MKCDQFYLFWPHLGQILPQLNLSFGGVGDASRLPGYNHSLSSASFIGRATGCNTFCNPLSTHNTLRFCLTPGNTINALLSFIVRDYSLATGVLVLAEGVCIFKSGLFDSVLKYVLYMKLLWRWATQHCFFSCLFFLNNRLLIVNMPKNQDRIILLIYSSICKV